MKIEEAKFEGMQLCSEVSTVQVARHPQNSIRPALEEARKRKRGHGVDSLQTAECKLKRGSVLTSMLV